MVHKFLPALDVDEVRRKNKRAWNYKALRPMGVLPSRFVNDAIVVQRDQQDRGTCVGQSSSCFMDYLHILNTGEVQTGNVVRGMTDPNGVVHDQLCIQQFSAECVYQEAQALGHIQSDDGAYVHDAIKSLVDQGICLESQWFTGKTTGKFYKTPYPATLDVVNTTRVQHKLEGYASITTLDELKQALYEKKAVIGAINVYSSYGSLGDVSPGMHNGQFPDPSPTDACIGAHALCFIGYDDDKKMVYFRHSWANWESIGSISYDYWSRYASDFWSGIDKDDVTIAQVVYKNVHVTSDPGVHVTIRLDGAVVTQGDVPFDVNLIVGKQYNICVTTSDSRTSTTQVMVNDGTTSINVVPESPAVKVNWLVTLIAAFIKFLGRK